MRHGAASRRGPPVAPLEWCCGRRLRARAQRCDDCRCPLRLRSPRRKAENEHPLLGLYAWAAAACCCLVRSEGTKTCWQAAAVSCSSLKWCGRVEARVVGVSRLKAPGLSQTCKVAVGWQWAVLLGEGSIGGAEAPRVLLGCVALLGCRRPCVPVYKSLSCLATTLPSCAVAAALVCAAGSIVAAELKRSAVMWPTEGCASSSSGVWKEACCAAKGWHTTGVLQVVRLQARWNATNQWPAAQPVPCAPGSALALGWPWAAAARAAAPCWAVCCAAGVPGAALAEGKRTRCEQVCRQPGPAQVPPVHLLRPLPRYEPTLWHG